jgi:dipeptide transport system ATP-binding protein
MTSAQIPDSPAAVVQAQGLSQSYRIGQGLFRPAAMLHAAHKLSFRIDAGRTLAVVGESGCGKSTLARMVALAESPASGSLLLGGMQVAGASTTQQAALRQRVQMVFQNPYASLNPRQRSGQILQGTLQINSGLNPQAQRAQAAQMLERVGLRPEHIDRYPHMFSGGQRQRIAIARALMLSPTLLVADEPVSALDVSIQAQILNLLADLQASLGLAYLFISHDLGVVRHIAHEVLVMYLGHTMEQGDKDTIFERPLHPYTRALLGSTPTLRRGLPGAKRIVLQGELPSPLAPPSGCVFSTRCPHATPRCHQERPLLQAFHGRLIACHEAATLAETAAVADTGTH